MAQPTCLICQQRATLYCPVDICHLCKSCDIVVHSANPIASRHKRVPCQQPDENSQAGFEDDMFAVPDVPLVPPSVDFPGWNDVSGPLASSDAQGLLGKEFEHDLDIFDMDPTWLDRLDMGFDDLTQSILDGVVPEFNDEQKPPSFSARPGNESGEDSRHSTYDESLFPPAAYEAPAQHAYSPPAYEAPSPPSPVPVVSRATTSARATSRATHRSGALAVPTADWSPYGEVVPQNIATFVPPSLRPVDAKLIADRAADRRIRLARYREKKKNRQFKKTIRYASRKAYAEVRPRVKGRFARKDEVAAMRSAGLLSA